MDGSDSCTEANDASLQIAGDMTISLWIEPDTVASATTVLIKGTAAGRTGNFGIGWDGLANLVFMHQDGADCTSSYTATTAWQHIVAVRDVDATPDTITWYVNGVSQGTNNCSLAVNTSSTTLSFGQSGSAGQFFDGRVTELAIWNTELNSTDVGLLYKSYIKGMPLQIRPANLQAYWPFDDKSDGNSFNFSTARDYSQNDNSLSCSCLPAGCYAFGNTFLSYSSAMAWTPLMDTTPASCGWNTIPDTIEDTAFAPQPIITLYNDNPETISIGTWSDDSMSFTILNNPANGTLVDAGAVCTSGTCSMNLVDGVADFTGDGINIDNPGVNYSLRATLSTDTSITCDSNTFYIFYNPGGTDIYEIKGYLIYEDTAGAFNVISWLEKNGVPQDLSGCSATLDIVDPNTLAVTTGCSGSCNDKSMTYRNLDVDVFSYSGWTPADEDYTYFAQPTITCTTAYGGSFALNVSAAKQIGQILDYATDINTQVAAIYTEIDKANWDDIQIMTKKGINWTDMAVLTTKGVNWTDLNVLTTEGINWTDIEELTLGGINWDDIAEMSDAGVNWDDLYDLTTAGVNWTDIYTMSEKGINWADIDVMSDKGINWADIDVLSDAGINWADLDVLSDAGINWEDLEYMSEAAVNWYDLAYMTGSGVNWTEQVNWDNLAELTTAGVNWNDLDLMSDAGLNWYDLEIMTKASVNWADWQVLSGAGINWADLDVMSDAGINWADIDVLSDKGINWTSINDMSDAGINWADLDVLSDTGINWADIDVLSDKGINWTSINDMSDAGINWADIDVLSDAGINWADIDVLSDKGINWDDIQIMSDKGINWTSIDDLSSAGINWDNINEMSGAGVNWDNLGELAQAGINWTDMMMLSVAGINWDDLQVLSETGVNWVDINVLTKAGVNWTSIRDLSAAGINWEDIEVLSESGINWDDINIMSDAGINWADIGVMSDAGINWADIDAMSDTGINWADIDVMTDSGVNWADISYMSGTGINWTDMGASSTTGINWSDLAFMSNANVNWSDIAYLADNARALVANVASILTSVQNMNTLIGAATDTSSSNTLFGKIAGVLDAVNNISGVNLSSDITLIKTSLSTLTTTVGSSTDTSSTTLFGTINTIDTTVSNVETLMGTDADADTTTIFGSLSGLSDMADNIDTAKSNAGAVLQEVQGIRAEIGAQGRADVFYEKVGNIQKLMAELRTSAEAISASQVESNTLAAEIIDTLTNFVNESAKAVGLVGEGVEVQPFESGAIVDAAKIDNKLSEIIVKVSAIKESVEKQDVVVKTYFESGE
ncbi:MAG: LamG domain-containing protein [Candidatus Omnitrophota bacterium]